MMTRASRAFSMSTVGSVPCRVMPIRSSIPCCTPWPTIYRRIGVNVRPRPGFVRRAYFRAGSRLPCLSPRNDNGPRQPFLDVARIAETPPMATRCSTGWSIRSASGAGWKAFATTAAAHAPTAFSFRRAPASLATNSYRVRCWSDATPHGGTRQPSRWLATMTLRGRCSAVAEAVTDDERRARLGPIALARRLPCGWRVGLLAVPQGVVAFLKGAAAKRAAPPFALRQLAGPTPPVVGTARRKRGYQNGVLSRPNSKNMLQYNSLIGFCGSSPGSQQNQSLPKALQNQNRCVGTMSALHQG